MCVCVCACVRVLSSLQMSGKELSRLSRDPTLDLRDPVLSNILRRGGGARRRGGAGPQTTTMPGGAGPQTTAGGGGYGAPFGGPAPALTMGVADCVDGCTQTDISFQHMLTLGKSGTRPCGAQAPPTDPPPSPPLPPSLEPYLLNEL